MDWKQKKKVSGEFDPTQGGKSTGVTLYPRGRRALMAVLSQQDFESVTVPLFGRMLHFKGPNKEAIHVPLSVGKFEKQMLTINRTGCQALCLDIAEKSGATVVYGANVVGVDIEAAAVEYTLELRKGAGRGEVTKISADTVVGADGAFSVVREAFMRQRIYCVDKFQVDGFTHGW